jgi:hypothetical protein
MRNGLGVRVSSCAVCGSREVETDAVEHGGWLLLAQCPRCDHRWTQALYEPPALVRAAVRAGVREVRPEVASAA